MDRVKFGQQVTTTVTDKKTKRQEPVTFEAGQEVDVDLGAIRHVDPNSYEVLDAAPKTTEMDSAPKKS